MKTESSDEALALLAKRRAKLITVGRTTARRIAAEHGIVHARNVRERMVEDGTYDPDMMDRWLGAVFRTGFVWTGDWHEYSYTDNQRSCHSNRIKVWKLM
jgi:hypothetical protein